MPAWGLGSSGSTASTTAIVAAPVGTVNVWTAPVNEKVVVVVAADDTGSSSTALPASATRPAATAAIDRARPNTDGTVSLWRRYMPGPVRTGVPRMQPTA